MKQRQSYAVEILPHALSEYAVGSIKSATCRVCKNGKNIATPKVKQPNKEGRDPNLFTKGADKWRTLSGEIKGIWKKIAKEHDFWSNWTAFMSSFLLSAEKHGLDYTMENDLNYISSESRFEKQQHLQNSIDRMQKYEVDPDHYVQTEEILNNYPVVHDSPLIYVKLLDLHDVNNALKCKLAYHTDTIVEYQFFPDEAASNGKSGDVEQGCYIRYERKRQGDELYESL